MFKKILLFFVFCFFSHQLAAKKLYKYQDEEGRWFYTDEQPITKQKVEVKQLKASAKRYIWLEKTGDKHKSEYYAINNYYGPVEIEARLEQSDNVISSPELPKRFIVDPGHSKPLFKMVGINEFKSWHFSLQYRYTIGSPLAVHELNVAYLPPFAKNSKFRISQAFAGKYSHSNEQNFHAVDIAMPVNTAIHAARSGTVIEVNNDYYKNGTTQAFKSRANSIRILHNDGTMAIYAHLALEKAQVYPGLKIKTGQLIGYSGNTGFSTGPHLHFAVQLNKGMALASVYFKFKGPDGSTNEPVVGAWLNN